MRSWFQDMRYALRMIFKAPSLTVVAVLTLVDWRLAPALAFGNAVQQKTSLDFANGTLALAFANLLPIELDVAGIDSLGS